MVAGLLTISYQRSASPYTCKLLCLVQTVDAQRSARLLTIVELILLALEGGLIVPMAFLYLLWMRRGVAQDRVGLYSIFLRVPWPTVVAMAKAEIKMMGEDEDDNDEPVVCSCHSAATNSCLTGVAQLPCFAWYLVTCCNKGQSAQMPTAQG